MNGKTYSNNIIINMYATDLLVGCVNL